MNRIFICLIFTAVNLIVPVRSFSQKFNQSLNQITASDLESHISFLASPLLKGRMNGDAGLEIAGQYLASQAKLLGLKPANGNSYLQPYIIEKKSIDMEKTSIRIISKGNDTITIKKPLFPLLPSEITGFKTEGEVVFAGYGGGMTESDPLAFNGLRRVSDGFFLKASWLFTRNTGAGRS